MKIRLIEAWTRLRRLVRAAVVAVTVMAAVYAVAAPVVIIHKEG
jgi:hypothetical protein